MVVPDQRSSAISECTQEIEVSHVYSSPPQWAVYARNMIRAVTGLRVIADLLNNGHDAVVRAGATALRNLATDPHNKASLGESTLRGEGEGGGCSSLL